jgi:hypothetical protein
MRSIRRLTLFAGIAALALCAVPALASADVYCVDTLPTGCDHIGYTGSAGLQQALSDAQAHSGADAVHIGSGTYPTLTTSGFNYSSTDPVTITGAGQGNTVITVTAPGSVPPSFTSYRGLQILGPSSSIASLSVTLPAPADAASTNQQYVGIDASGANNAVNSVTVQGPGVATNASGVRMTSGNLTSSTIAMPLGTSLQNRGFWELNSSNDDVLIEQDDITADIPVEDDNQSAGTVRINRSILHPSAIGVNALASHVTVANSLIDLGSHSGAKGISAGYGNSFSFAPSILSADGVTIYGSGTAQVGAAAFATDDNQPLNPGDPEPPPDTATLTLASSIINLTGSSPRAIDRAANNGNTVNVTTSYSNYDASTIVDSGNPNGAIGGITQSHQTNLSPGFVNPGTDFHLSSSSPLIDIGDPAGTSFGAQDIDGDNRVVLGKPGCAARRDIGADEFVPVSPITPDDCTPPDTIIDSGPTGTVTDTAPTFTFHSDEQPSTFECSLDGAAMQPCTSPLTSAPLSDGPHTFAVQATDASSNTDPTPAVRSFMVDTTAPDTAIGSHPKPKTKSRKATFAFSSTEPGSSFLCSYDGKPYTACTTSFTTPKLKPGRHRFDVISTDAVGHRDQSAATFLWKIVKRKHHRR